MKQSQKPKQYREMEKNKTADWSGSLEADSEMRRSVSQTY